MRTHRIWIVILLFALSALSLSCGSESGTPASGTDTPAPAATPAVDVVKVKSQKLEITVRIPGELRPDETVAIYSKVTGFVRTMRVDRGSRVKTGELLAQLEAPELVAQRAEAQARLQGADSQRIEAEAKLAAEESTYRRLKAASATPGVISGNELDVAQKAADGDRARVAALRENVEAARQALKSVEEIEGYLKVTAPFDGMVTERNVHPGALVGPSGGLGSGSPMLRVEKTSRLRLIVPVPEIYVGGVSEGIRVPFTVSAYPGETFNGVIRRIAHSVDEKTRTMPVELDVANSPPRLDPGMFAEVQWPVRRAQATLFVPASAVARTTERTFVIRVRNGKAEWVDVNTGATSGPLIEVFGDLQSGDDIVVRGTDELRVGTSVTPRAAGPL